MWKLDPGGRSTESSGQMLYKNVTGSTRHRSEITHHKDPYRERQKLSNKIATRRMRLACHWYSGNQHHAKDTDPGRHGKNMSGDS